MHDQYGTIIHELRNNPTDPRGGLMAVQLPSVNGRNNVKLPARLSRNRRYEWL